MFKIINCDDGVLINLSCMNSFIIKIKLNAVHYLSHGSLRLNEIVIIERLIFSKEQMKPSRLTKITSTCNSDQSSQLKKRIRNLFCNGAGTIEKLSLHIYECCTYKTCLSGINLERKCKKHPNFQQNKSFSYAYKNLVELKVVSIGMVSAIMFDDVANKIIEKKASDFQKLSEKCKEEYEVFLLNSMAKKVFNFVVTKNIGNKNPSEQFLLKDIE